LSETPPLLEPDERSAPFFEAAVRGRLLLQRCDRCGAWHFPVRRRCSTCGATTLAWAEASGRGTVHGHVRTHRAAHPALRARLPLTLVVVDLEEGVRVRGRLAAGSPPVRARHARLHRVEPTGRGVA